MTPKSISPEEFYKKVRKQGNVTLLDVRATEKYNEFHIEEAKIDTINIPKTDIFNSEEFSISSLPKEKEIIVTCTTGNSATKCANILSEKEYDVTILEGGITAWKDYLKTIKE